MLNNKPCNRILLAGTVGCRVVYCEECGVAEMEIGAVSIRLELNALHDLKAVLGQASMKLSLLNAIKVSQNLAYDKLDLH